MGAAGTTHQCTAAPFKLVELNNFTPSVDKNTLWWIWTRIYWNTIISLAFPLILVWLYYFTIYQFTKWTMSHFWLECHTKIILVSWQTSPGDNGCGWLPISKHQRILQWLCFYKKYAVIFKVIMLYELSNPCITLEEVVWLHSDYNDIWCSSCIQSFTVCIKSNKNVNLI